MASNREECRRAKGVLEGSLKPSTLDETAIAHIRKVSADRGYIIFLSGADGSGKSTTAKVLCNQLSAAGLSVIHRHCYAWHKNLIETPRAIAKARRDKVVMVLDRSIYDNIIEVARKLSPPIWATKTTLRIASAIYPSADLKLFTWAPLEELLRRRPEEPEAKQNVNLVRYECLEKIAGFQRLTTDNGLMITLSNLVTN